MKRLFSPYSAALVLALSLSLSPAFAAAQVVLAPDAVDAPMPDATTTPEVIVKYKDSPDITVVDAAPDVSVETLVDHLESSPNVEYAEPNYERQIFTISSNDTYKGLEWGLDNTGQSVNGTTGTANADINAPEAWTLAEGTSTLVAVIDVGVEYRHPDIANQMWDGSSCVDENGNTISGGCLHGYFYAQNPSFNSNDPLPDTGGLDHTAFHGSHVSGIVAAEQNNGLGITGVAPHAKIMAIRFGLDVASEVKAIDFARQNGAKIINASYGGNQFSQAEYDAIKRFTDAGGIFVAAAGNDSANNDGNTHTYPSDYDLPNIISVAATDSSDNLASFSNYGSTSVDVGAPGTNIVSLYPTYSNSTPSYAYAYADGTSMATPMVAGEAALIWSLNPSLSSSDVRSLIESTGDSISALSGKTTTGKRINAYNALLALSTTSSAVLSGLPSATTTDAVPGLNVTVGGAGVTQYKYNLDSAGWSSTTTVATPITATAMLNGAHSLSVIGATAYGNWQSTTSATTYSWNVVDTSAPDITGLSSDTSGVTTKTWTWSSTDPSATFAYAVDDASTSPDTLGSFSTTTSAVATTTPGTYYLHIMSKDNNGNTSATTTVSVLIISPPPPAPPASSGGSSSSSSGGGGGGGGGGASPAPTTSVLGDSNNDGKVDLLDFNSLMIHWSEHTNPLADFNTLMVHWTP